MTQKDFKEDFKNEIEQEIKAIITEETLYSNLIEIRMYHKIGSLIVGSGLSPNVFEIPEHIKKYSVLFYKKYPIPTEEIESFLPFGKLVSWSKIKKEL